MIIDVEENEQQIRLYTLLFTKQAQKDALKIKTSNLKPKVIRLLDIISSDPWQQPPRYERLLGDLEGAYSRRINYQHRLVYQVYELSKIIKIIRMWTHYGH